MIDEEWEDLWQYILKMGQRDDDMCDIKCDWVDRLTEWRKEWDDEQRAQRKIDRELWEEYLQEWGRDEECPVCKMPIYYIQPEDFQDGASLFVPCHQGCGGLYVTNTEGNISSQFIEKGEEEPK